MYILKRIVGWLRLHFGRCPLCNSSLAKKGCPVCLGTYMYQHTASKNTRWVWKKRYIRYLKLEKTSKLQTVYYKTAFKTSNELRAEKKEDNV